MQKRIQEQFDKDMAEAKKAEVGMLERGQPPQSPGAAKDAVQLGRRPARPRQAGGRLRQHHLQDDQPPHRPRVPAPAGPHRPRGPVRGLGHGGRHGVRGGPAGHADPDADGDAPGPEPGPPRDHPGRRPRAARGDGGDRADLPLAAPVVHLRGLQDDPDQLRVPPPRPPGGGHPGHEPGGGRRQEHDGQQPGDQPGARRAEGPAGGRRPEAAVPARDLRDGPGPRACPTSSRTSCRCTGPCGRRGSRTWTS